VGYVNYSSDIGLLFFTFALLWEVLDVTCFVVACVVEKHVLNYTRMCHPYGRGGSMVVSEVCYIVFAKDSVCCVGPYFPLLAVILMKNVCSFMH
jgi:hypothetical protein